MKNQYRKAHAQDKSRHHGKNVIDFFNESILPVGSEFQIFSESDSRSLSMQLVIVMIEWLLKFPLGYVSER